VTLDVSPDLLRRQVTLMGSWTFSKQGQAECAEFIADRKVDVERLFTHRWRLEQAEEAYRLFDTSNVIPSPSPTWCSARRTEEGGIHGGSSLGIFSRASR
jgi:hypothetical protein